MLKNEIRMKAQNKPLQTGIELLVSEGNAIGSLTFAEVVVKPNTIKDRGLPVVLSDYIEINKFIYTGAFGKEIYISGNNRALDTLAWFMYGLRVL